MPTTRSSTKKQVKLEDVTGNHDQDKESSPSDRDQSKFHAKEVANKSAPNTKRKRKDKPKLVDIPQKRQKQQHFSADKVENVEPPIVINRAPVLQLWGAVVAEFLHPNLSWPSCLSIGNAISTLCAISKGRAIGMIEPKDGENSDNRSGEGKQSREETKQVSVMGFSLHLRDEAVLIKGKPKPSSEEALMNKFGKEQYEAAKKVMSESLDLWDEGDKDELDSKAFHMYERFRPNIAAGQRGWGRKGELNLHEVANIIKPSG